GGGRESEVDAVEQGLVCAAAREALGEVARDGGVRVPERRREECALVRVVPVSHGPPPRARAAGAGPTGCGSWPSRAGCPRARRPPPPCSRRGRRGRPPGPAPGTRRAAARSPAPTRGGA